MFSAVLGSKSFRPSTPPTTPHRVAACGHGITGSSETQADRALRLHEERCPRCKKLRKESSPKTEQQ